MPETDPRGGAPGADREDPSSAVIATEELRAWSSCLSSVLSELESRVLSLYLDGHSYEADRRAARVRHEDGRQRPPARQAQGRRPHLGARSWSRAAEAHGVWFAAVVGGARRIACVGPRVIAELPA